MKRLLLLILLSVGFTNVSYALDLCPNGSNPKRSVSSDGSYYVYKCSTSSSSYSSPYSSGDSFTIPDNAHADGSNGWVCDALYIKSGFRCIKESNQTINKKGIPKNAHKVLESWTCNADYYRNNTKTGCLKVPENAYSSYTSNIFTCFPRYKKTGFQSCIPKLIIPKNAKASGLSFMCNNGYFKNKLKTLCLRVPANAKKTSNDLAYSCNTGYKKSGSKCVPKLIIPKNAKASGSSFMCNNGYYKNSATTGCLKVPAYAKKRSNDKAGRAAPATLRPAQVAPTPRS